MPRVAATAKPNEVEVVISTVRNLENLAHWRDVLEGVHLIVVVDGDPGRQLRIPDRLNVSVYGRSDIENQLGDRSWIISTMDSACRCFGFLVASAQYVYTFDDDCIPPAPTNSEDKSPLVSHIDNLKLPSHPDYFNTLYDFEFVRGYPHALRAGKPTAISHGLWLNHPDLDALTQQKRPDLRIAGQIPIVQTVPRGVQYSMCGMNLAFDRRLIGPAMYFGLMGKDQPWGRYDDMWAGWCSKAICDHLGFGVKTGRPYLVHTKASDWRRNIEKEANGIRWGRDLYEFFQSVEFSSLSTSATDCYRELAEQTEQRLARLDPYFVKLADAMRTWLDVWIEQEESRAAGQPSTLTAQI